MEGDKAVRSIDETDVFNSYLEQYNPLPMKYIRGLLTDNSNEFDHKYGIRHDAEIESFHIGNSRIHIDGNDLVLQNNNKRYKGTIGLYELLFKKAPKNFDKYDLEAYREIILKTSAHKRYYQKNQQVDGSRLPKYTKIISPLIHFDSESSMSSSNSGSSRSKSVGYGLQKEVNNNTIDYVYWYDVNELVDRLRLLIASNQAGNNNHRSEIVSISEELTEAGYIE